MGDGAVEVAVRGGGRERVRKHEICGRLLSAANMARHQRAWDSG